MEPINLTLSTWQILSVQLLVCNVVCITAISGTEGMDQTFLMSFHRKKITPPTNTHTLLRNGTTKQPPAQITRATLWRANVRVADHLTAQWTQLRSINTTVECNEILSVCVCVSVSVHVYHNTTRPVTAQLSLSDN